MIPEPACVLYITHLWLSIYQLFALCIVNLFVNYHQLYKETSLMKSEI